MSFVSNYQKMLDSRLSRPKILQKILMDTPYKNKDKFYKNSPFEDQHRHQKVFKTFSRSTNWSDLKDMQDNDVSDKTKYISHLEAAFQKNYRRYDILDRPQNHRQVKQLV